MALSEPEGTVRIEGNGVGLAAVGECAGVSVAEGVAFVLGKGVGVIKAEGVGSGDGELW